tara:strand:- start:90 stop:878 length:789 start_codon:yes stop_codon:yes gene_type:complete
MANRIPVKAIYSGTDVTSLGEYTSTDKIDGAYLADGTVTAAKLAADTATQAELDAVAAAALPLAGGTMTGDTAHADNVKAKFGASDDLQIYHGGGGSFIDDAGEGELKIRSNYLSLQKYTGENMIAAVADGAVSLFYDDAAKLATTATGVSITGTVVATTTTDASNTGNVTLDFAANQNFVLTLQGATTLVNPSTEQVGQSGFITFIQDGTGGRVVSLGTDYETAGAAGITLSTAASATDIVPYVVVAANRILLGTPQLAFA